MKRKICYLYQLECRIHWQSSSEKWKDLVFDQVQDKMLKGTSVISWLNENLDKDEVKQQKHRLCV